MKKIFFLCCLLASCLCANAESVRVDGLVRGRKVLFQTITVKSLATGRPELVTTIPLKGDNSFVWTTDLTRSDYFVFLFQGAAGIERQQYVVLHPGDNLRLVYQSEQGGLGLDSVRGSADMQLVSDYQRRMGQMIYKLQPIEQQYQKATTDAQRQQIQAQYMSTYQQLMGDYELWLRQNSNLFASALLAYSDFSSDFRNHKGLFTQIYNSLKNKYAYQPIIKEIATRLTNAVERGKMAPELEGKSPDGTIYRLSDLKGKVVLVDFWASWCGPCRRENPNVKAMYQKYHSKGFEVFSVSLDSDEISWKSAIQMDGLSWPYHISTLKRWSCPLAASYQVRSIPFSVLVDARGLIVGIGLRGEALQNKLAEIFGF